MRFHGLMLVRDEGDIIAQNLQHLLTWANDVFILDTGSTDDTWDIINDFAARETRIKPIERSAVVYGNPLRAYLFDKVRHDFLDGDWIVKLDADEFYQTPPPDFVADHLLPAESCVWLQWYYFRLTSQEVADYESGRVDTAEDRRLPIEERRRFYKTPHHSEPRMFRYRAAMKWSEKNSFPNYAGLIACERIPIRHYPHRDPDQMRVRYALRAEMKRLGSPAGSHWDLDQWRRDVISFDGKLDAARENQASEVGLAAVSGHITGPLLYWEPGTDLPPALSPSHLKPLLIRYTQHCLYRCILPVADTLVRGCTPGFRPLPITDSCKVVLPADRKPPTKTRHAGVGAFHGLMLVRDEDDIIEQCLRHLLTWIDAVYVLDLGSADQTWNIVQELASREKRIVPIRSDPCVFSNSLRASLFQEFRSRFRDGDWILRLDADEFYHIPPPTFVNERIWKRETCIYLGWYFFRFTSGELEEYKSGRLSVMADRARPIEDRRRFFKVTEHAEPRLFRYRPAMKWSPSASFPYHAGYVARERIPIRHYPHRDPLQMEKRYRLRSEMIRLKAEAFPQWNVQDWQREVIIVDPNTGYAHEQTARGEGLSATEGHTTGELHEWKPGETLPPLSTGNHLGSWPRSLIQRAIHPRMLPLLDRMRTGWPPDIEPPGSRR